MNKEELEKKVERIKKEIDNYKESINQEKSYHSDSGEVGIYEEMKYEAEQELKVCEGYLNLINKRDKTVQFVTKNRMILIECLESLVNQKAIGNATQDMLEKEIEEYNIIIKMLTD